MKSDNFVQWMYAVSVVASKHSNVRHTAFMVRAYNIDEANGIAMRIAKKLYPESKYSNLNVVVVPDDHILEYDTATPFE